MPGSNLNYKSQGFFNHSDSLLEKNKPAIIDVGGNGDCGFRSVAAGLIDQFLENPQGNEAWVTTFLANHHHYFPEHRSNLPGLTSIERMQQLIKDIRMTDLLVAMAYTFRQMAVTEMVNHPESYRGAFVARNEGTTPANMRKQGTWIDESSIAALAKTLQIMIKVQVVERTKTLPLVLKYNHTELEGPQVTMQLQHGHYKPVVAVPSRFTSSARIVREPQLAKDRLPQDPDFSEILKKIAAEDKRLTESFENTHRRIMSAVMAGELTQKDLLACYIKAMPTSDYLQGRIAHVGLEQGNQHFFDAIQNMTAGKTPTENSDHIVNELTHAISRAIAIGHMDANRVFAHIDEMQSPRVIRVH